MLKTLSKVLILLMMSVFLVTFAGCQGNQSEPVEETETVIEDEDSSGSEESLDNSSSSDSKDSGSSSSESADGDVVNVVMEVNGGQKVEMELYPDVAPKTVDNFVKLVNEGFYDGLTFHRVIPGFVIQGGDPEGTGMGGSDETIVGEFESNGFENDLKHERGVLSMARSGDPDSASSQFFICVDDAPNLDGDYAAFGKVTSGMDQVDKIVEVETDANDKPLEDQIIEKMYVVK